jgi:hypothetical protein
MLMHVVDGLDGINDRFLANELAPIPGQSSAHNAGFSQGYLGVPFKGGHTEQFILGYINGSQGIQDNKAEVAVIWICHFIGIKKLPNIIHKVNGFVPK